MRSHATHPNIRLPGDGLESRMQHNTPLSVGSESGVADERACEEAAWLCTEGLAVRRRPGCKKTAWPCGDGLAVRTRPGCAETAWLYEDGLAVHGPSKSHSSVKVYGPLQSPGSERGSH